MSKTLFIFDCFGVITSEIAPIWFASRYPADEAKKLKEMYFAGADRGDKTIGELVDGLSLGLNIPREEIIEDWKRIFTVNFDLINLIRELKKNHNIALLSNAPCGLVEAIVDKYEIGDLFDKIFISSHYKMSKPDRGFYRLCMDSFDNIDSFYMIDDNFKNLDGLSELNIKTHLFKTNELLKDYLRKEGFL